MTVSTIQKITASIAVPNRFALGVKTSEAVGTKNDGSTRYASIQWAMGSNYSQGKLTGFSLYFMEFTGKRKGEFTEVAKLVPCLKSGFSLQFLTNNRTSVKDAIESFIKPDMALFQVQSMNLPVQFFILATVFDRAEVVFPEKVDQLVQIKPVDPSVWEDVKALTQTKLPQFSGLSTTVEPTHKAIADQPTITIPQVALETAAKVIETTEANKSKDELQAECNALGITFKRAYGVSKLAELILNHAQANAK